MSVVVVDDVVVVVVVVAVVIFALNVTFVIGIVNDDQVRADQCDPKRDPAERAVQGDPGDDCRRSKVTKRSS